MKLAIEIGLDYEDVAAAEELRKLQPLDARVLYRALELARTYEDVTRGRPLISHDTVDLLAHARLEYARACNALRRRHEGKEDHAVRDRVNSMIEMIASQHVCSDGLSHCGCAHAELYRSLTAWLGLEGRHGT